MPSGWSPSFGLCTSNFERRILNSTQLSGLDLEAVKRLATQLTLRLPAEMVIGLVGTLGAGKTTFTQALAEAAGVDPDDVTSPTFTLLCSYDATVAAGKIRLHHLDTYRVNDEDEFLELGVEELFEAHQTWTLIEWADRVESVLPAKTLWITIDVEAVSPGSDEPTRSMTLASENEDFAKLLQSLDVSGDEA